MILKKKLQTATNLKQWAKMTDQNFFYRIRVMNIIYISQVGALKSQILTFSYTPTSTDQLYLEPVLLRVKKQHKFTWTDVKIMVEQ